MYSATIKLADITVALSGTSRTTEDGGERGYDADKKVTGRKRQLA